VSSIPSSSATGISNPPVRRTRCETTQHRADPSPSGATRQSLAELGDLDDALDLLTIAYRDPAANAQSQHEIERVLARLAVPLDAVTGRSPGIDGGLDAAVARILGPDA
jgi:hypothetical protein